MPSRPIYRKHGAVAVQTSWPCLLFLIAFIAANSISSIDAFTSSISTSTTTANSISTLIPFLPGRSDKKIRQTKTILSAIPPAKEERMKTKTKSPPSLSDQQQTDNAIASSIPLEDKDGLLFGVPESTAKPLMLLLLSQFILFIGVGAVIPTIPLYGKEIGLSSAANGIVISAPALALLLLAKPAGQYADKARKPAMMWGMAIIALSDLGTAMAQSIVPLIIARLGLGAGRCISESGERGLLADFAETIPELRGRVLSIGQVVVALGIAVGAPAGGLVVEQYGPRASFLCVTAAALLALFLYSFLPETLQTDSSSSTSTSTPAAVTTTDSSTSLNSKTILSKDSDTKGFEEEDAPHVDWRELLQESKWRGLSLFEIGAKFGYAAKLASIPIIAASVLPGGAVGAGALLSAAGLSGLVGGPMGGFLSDRIGAKNTILLTGMTSALGLIMIPFALQYTSPDGIPDGAAFTVAVLLWSTSVAAQNPASNAFAQEIAPSGSTATAMALPKAAGDAVYLFAPFLLGYVSDLSGAPTGTDCLFAGVCGLLGIAALAGL
jgi:MFS family permease